MKKSIIALAVLAIAGSAFATGSYTPSATIKVTGSGTNSVVSSTASGSYVNGAGSSLSKASNTQSATAYVGGSGSYSSKPGNAFVSIADCTAPKKVHGTQTLGAVLSFGGTSASGASTASNVSTGAGVGGAQATGASVAEVAGKTTLTSPNINLAAEGSAFSVVVTNTGVVGTNGSGASTGATASAFKADANGSLFTYKVGDTVGDIKTITSNTFTRVGGIPQVTTACGGAVCVTGPSIATGGAIVEGGATANAGGQVNAVLQLGTKPATGGTN